MKKATLVHNPAAGRGSPSPEEILDLMRSCGFDPSYISTAAEDPPLSLQDPGDLVVVAGGDGTVSTVAKELRNTNVLILLIPIGTANNIATSLGISGTLTECFNVLDGVTRRLDIGVLTTLQGGNRFLEGFGLGLFPGVVASLAGWKDNLKGSLGTTAQELAQDLDHWVMAVKSAETRDYRINIDGVDRSGRYFLVEILNTPLLGPALSFGSNVDPSDGMLDLVVAEDVDRPHLEQFLESALIGESRSAGLRAWRGTRIRIEWTRGAPRVDGELRCIEDFRDGRDLSVTATVEAGAVAFLVGT